MSNAKSRRSLERKQQIERLAQIDILERMLKSTAELDTASGMRAYITGALEYLRERAEEERKR